MTTTTAMTSSEQNGQGAVLEYAGQASKAGHELTCRSPGSVPAGHVGAKTDTWIDPDPWETGTRTCGSGFDGYFRGSYLRVLAMIVNIH